ncbi:hypothetical protein Tco_1533240 [Tanacetum coccineum]
MLMASSKVCGLEVVTFPSILLGWAYAFYQDKASSVRFLVFAIGVLVGPVFLLGLLITDIVVAYASRAAVTLSGTSFLMAA